MSLHFTNIVLWRAFLKFGKTYMLIKLLQDIKISILSIGLATEIDYIIIKNINNFYDVHMSKSYKR